MNRDTWIGLSIIFSEIAYFVVAAIVGFDPAKFLFNVVAAVLIAALLALMPFIFLSLLGWLFRIR